MGNFIGMTQRRNSFSIRKHYAVFQFFSVYNNYKRCWCKEQILQKHFNNYCRNCCKLGIHLSWGMKAKWGLNKDTFFSSGKDKKLSTYWKPQRMSCFQAFLILSSGSNIQWAREVAPEHFSEADVIGTEDGDEDAGSTFWRGLPPWLIRFFVCFFPWTCCAKGMGPEQVKSLHTAHLMRIPSGWTTK